jgi:hypothetical protein
MRRYWGATIFLSLLILVLLPGVVTGQQEGAQVRVVNVDAAEFPTVVLLVEAIDGENNRIADIGGLALFEEGQPIEDFEAEPLDVGVDLFFVIDANDTIEDIDQVGGESRREKVRDSIIRYANYFMDPTQLDRVTIIVPEGNGGRFLDRPNMLFANEVINAVNFYQPAQLGDVSLDRLLLMALDEAERTAEEGRHQAIVLFSDAANLTDFPDMQEFMNQAQEQRLTVHPVILGSRADTNEMEQAAQLAEPTGGSVVHMPDPEATDDLYDRLQQRGTLNQIRYRSQLDSSGPHTISAELAGGQGEAIVDVVVEPAAVQLAVDNSRPILRVAADSETPLEQIEPTEQPLVAQVEWPDEHPRDVVSASLLVDGVEHPLDGSVLGADGVLTFAWDISALEDGVYPLQVQVVDELGLVGLSEALPLTIEIQRPVEVSMEEPTAVSAPTAAPATEPPAANTGQASQGFVIAGAGIVSLAALLLILVVVILLWRSRRQVPAAVPVQPPVQPAQPLQYQAPPAQASFSPAAQVEPDMTQVEMPAFVANRDVGAYLEVLENAPEHPGYIPLSGNNIVLGRDPRRVAIPFKDRSVSRVHARILESHGTYRIYDEGSASGTYVNYERVTLTPRTLEDNDQIHFGRVHLRFRLSLPGATGEENTQIYGQM